MLRPILIASLLLAGHAHASGNPPAPAVGAAGSTCGYVTDQRATIPKSQDIFPVEITRIDGRSTPLDSRNRHSVQPGERVLTVTDHIDPHRLPGAAVTGGKRCGLHEHERVIGGRGRAIGDQASFAVWAEVALPGAGPEASVGLRVKS